MNELRIYLTPNPENEMETETKAETKTPETIADVALAKVLASAGLAVKEITWPVEQIQLVKRMKCPPGTTDDEFAIFIRQCMRTGLDPMIDEAFCVPRNAKVRTPIPGKPTKDWPEHWVEKHVFQAAEAGMRSRADRFADYRGIKYAVVHEGDIFELDASGETLTHKYNPADPARAKKPIMGAWAQLKRDGRTCPPIWLPLNERRGAYGAWGDKPETMIAKCARAEAFRVEYPNAFGGIYIAEEMPEEEHEVNPPPSEGQSRSKTEEVAARVVANAAKAAAKAPEDAVIVPPPPKSPPKADPKKGPTVSFGPHKGRSIVDLDSNELATTLALGETEIQKTPLAPWTTKARACIEDLRAEIKRRLAMMDAPPPEPGAAFAPDEAPF